MVRKENGINRGAQGMDHDKISSAGETIVRGLRDNLLRPMHDSLAAQMKTQHDVVMRTVIEELPQNLLQSFAEGFRNVRWDDDETK